MRPHRLLASVLAGGAVLAPVDGLAKPRPSIHKQAQQAVKACAPYAGHIEAAEKARKLRRHTLTALLYSESRCKPDAESKKRARGLGQHTPSGAAAVGRIQRDKGQTPWFTYAAALNPERSIRAAATLMAHGLELCGDLAQALSLYNRGGRCGRPNAFSRAVLRLADAIRWVVGEEERS